MDTAARLLDGGLRPDAFLLAADGARLAERRGERRTMQRALAMATMAVGERVQQAPGALRLLPGSLTAREVAIAQMAAAGLRNAEIAERTGTSVRTIGNQLQSVFTKLGVRSRGELSGFLSDG